jgi:uncharacterized protein YecE (DUF72 family)
VTENARVGVSGFSYAGWRGTFYPEGMKGEDFLAYYSRHLNSTEVNSSFYASPKADVVKNWSSKTNEAFRFSFKAPKQITHILKLGEGSSEAADRLWRVLALLGQKRGPVLFQLPPYLRQELGLLDGFLSETSDIKDRVFEFRHESWLHESTYRLLERHSAGFCIAETEEMSPAFRVTGKFAYFRLRRDSYDSKAIDKWAKKIGETARGLECYAYLRHDETGENALLARRLSEKLAS